MILGSLKDDSYQRRQISPGIVAVDSSFVEAKKGERAEYNGLKKRKGIKIHAAVISGRSSIRHNYWSWSRI